MKLRYAIVLFLLLEISIIITEETGLFTATRILQELVPYALILTIAYAIYTFAKYITRTRRAKIKP